MATDPVKSIISDIKQLRVQGAVEVAKAGVLALELAARRSRAGAKKELLKELRIVAREVLHARPTEPALRQAVRFVIHDLQQYEGGDFDRHFVEMCKDHIGELNTSVEKIAGYGARIIREGDVVMTHCHSHAVVAILKHARADGKNFRVIVTETRPLMQGELTAKELTKAGVDVSYVIDSAAAHLMPGVSKVLVGADAILTDGSIVNKIGTQLIALAASAFSVPFIVAAGTHKFDSRTVLGFQEPLEERPAREVASSKRVGRASVRNPAFDITRARYITEIITEKGVYSPAALAALIAAMYSE